MLRDDLRRIKNEPSLLAIEVAWRWVFGAVAIALLAFAFVRLQHAIVVTPEEEAELRSGSPQFAAQALTLIIARALPVAARLAAVLLPCLLLLWTIAASAGRAVVLTGLVGPENAKARWSGIIGTHALRALSVVGLAAGYFGSSFIAAFFVESESPNLILFGLVLLLLITVVLAIWMWVHWVLSIATIYPVSEGQGTFASVKLAVRLIRMQGRRLTGVATSNGTARTMVALVFTLLGLLPIPLYRISPVLLIVIEVLIALVYCVISDWFLLARLGGYLEVAKAESSIADDVPRPL